MNEVLSDEEEFTRKVSVRERAFKTVQSSRTKGNERSLSMGRVAQLPTETWGAWGGWGEARLDRQTRCFIMILLPYKPGVFPFFLTGLDSHACHS